MNIKVGQVVDVVKFKNFINPHTSIFEYCAPDGKTEEIELETDGCLYYRDTGTIWMKLSEVEEKAGNYSFRRVK